jgi:tetratricopeptide (TPR) repeat protein
VLGFLAVAMATAQSASNTSQTLLILPFENSSKTPGLEWIGESFPEVMGERMGSATLYAVPREDRTYAFDRAGIPLNLRPSHATMFRIGEEMDVDFMVLGRYGYDGKIFSAEAQLLDVKHLRLLPPISESGPLISLIEIQTALAWDLLRTIGPNSVGPRNDFLADAAPVRLDAFEDYIRGISAGSRDEKIRKFREALRLNPNYVQAMMQMGHVYFEARQFDLAAGYFARVPRTDPAAREASFYTGMANYYTGDFEKAENAFSYLASLFPLTEVYNNLGVVQARRGKRTAVEYFQKAVDADENDPDYHFNLALALYKKGASADAMQQLRETLRLRASDSEAKIFLDSFAKFDPSTRYHLPLERIKRNYDETSFRQLALEVENATEARLAKSDPRTHAAYHVERGHDLLERRFIGDAGKQFREAVTLDPANAAAHAGLAAVLEARNDIEGARQEANAALKLQPSAEAYLVLARLDLHDHHDEAAAAGVDRALALEPANTAAAALKQTITAKLAERAQPKP